MKKNILSFIPIALFVIISSISCNKERHVIGVIIPHDSFVINVGTTKSLPVVVFPPDATNKTVTWSSSNTAIATVDNGNVTAIAKGDAVITVTTNDGGYQATCAVKVIDIPEIEMVFVEGGTFIMGCTDEFCYSDELPAHQVTLSPYFISKYLVTQELWEAVMEYNPSFHQNPDSKKHPVEQVSWYDVQTFLSILNQITGRYYTLPTEAQWEFAARGGNESKGYVYSGSNNPEEVAWYALNSNNTTHPVGTKLPNELGIYDMSGNVDEWCYDMYAFYTEEPKVDPIVLTSYYYNYHRVIRGGNFYDEAEYPLRPIRRGLKYEGEGKNTIGFRLVEIPMAYLEK